MGNLALAQEISLNYESLSSLEEPLATEIGDVTLVLAGLLSPARTTVIPTTPAFSVGSYWGTVLIGNISGVVREQTRRLRGVGNAALALDDIIGGLEDDGGGYFVRFGPWVFSGMMDDEENFDLGAMYQRPTGTRDYRLAARFTDSEYVSADGSRTFDTKAFSGVGEMIYGSTMWDIGVSYERLESHGLNVDRWYVSTGVRKKTGVLTVSVEGHYGQIANGDEASAAVGVQYDVARGLSANLGLNYVETRVSRGNTVVTDTKGNTATLSLRYSF